MLLQWPVHVFFAIANLFTSTNQAELVNDKDVSRYTYDFIADCKKYDKNCTDTESIPVYWRVPKNENWIAYCMEIRWIIFNKKIALPVKHMAIDPIWWNSATDISKKTLVYHELAHCILDLDHVDNGYMIMAPSIPEPQYLSNNWDCLVEQMFKNTNGICIGNYEYSFIIIKNKD